MQSLTVQIHFQSCGLPRTNCTNALNVILLERMPFMADEAAQISTDSRFCVVTLKIKEQVIGGAYVRYFNRQNEFHIAQLAIRIDYERQGLAQMLLRHIIDYADDCLVPIVTVHS